MKLFIFAVAMAQTLVLAGDEGGAGSARGCRQPNIIFISTDDRGIGKVPPLGLDAASRAIIRTPNLQKMKDTAEASGVSVFRILRGPQTAGGEERKLESLPA